MTIADAMTTALRYHTARGVHIHRYISIEKKETNSFAFYEKNFYLFRNFVYFKKKVINDDIPCPGGDRIRIVMLLPPKPPSIT